MLTWQHVVNPAHNFYLSRWRWTKKWTYHQWGGGRWLGPGMSRESLQLWHDDVVADTSLWLKSPAGVRSRDSLKRVFTQGRFSSPMWENTQTVCGGKNNFSSSLLQEHISFSHFMVAMYKNNIFLLYFPLRIHNMHAGGLPCFLKPYINAILPPCGQG